MSNPHTPTVAAEVEALMKPIEKWADAWQLEHCVGMSAQIKHDRNVHHVRTRLTTLLTRLRVAEEVCEKGRELGYGYPLNDINFAEGDIGLDGEDFAAFRHALSEHTRLRQEQDNG